MTEQSARLRLPYIQPAQAQKHVTHNEALERLDLMVQLVLQGVDVNTPPGIAQDGEIWALGLAPSGVWAGHPSALAAWVNNSWVFLTPAIGWRATLGDELRVWDGNTWAPLRIEALNNLTGIGVNTSFDSTNRLAVASDASLLNHVGAGHQLKVNKSAQGQTASLLFQTGFSGRAEMGTTGDDDFSIKVSGDGNDWNDGLRITSASGLVTLPQGAQIDGTVTGTAVTQAADDSTPGRLLQVGDFGLGRSAGSYSAEASLATDFRDANAFGLQTVSDENTGFPSGFAGNSAALVVLRGASGDRGVQVLHGLGSEASGSDAGLAIRAFRNSGNDGAWQIFFNTHNILGTVSQSAGVPTGALVERGNSANGSYVRFADGTQICTRSIAHDLTDIEPQNWDYPIPFAGAPVASFAVVGTDAAALEAWAENGGTGWAEASGWRTRHLSALGSATISVQLTATGRWF